MLIKDVNKIYQLIIYIKKDTKQINFNDEINKELVLFSKSSTKRAIQNIMVKQK